ncbi:MAG: GatB/YqeY domain-containing protein [Deltaproteobacteria bacterium]|nr:GatB/YqeY domain-containing protein [Deltaproteobacteria bacterium]
MEEELSEAQLRHQLQDAMKRRDRTTVDVLRGLLAVVANRRIDAGGGELPASEILTLVQREAKKREEVEEFARRAGRDDLVAQNAAERAILARYLPTVLSDAELTALVQGWIAEGVDAMGPLMARLKDRHPGRYDGRRASEIVRGLLAAR